MLDPGATARSPVPAKFASVQWTTTHPVFCGGKRLPCQPGIEQRAPVYAQSLPRLERKQGDKDPHDEDDDDVDPPVRGADVE